MRLPLNTGARIAQKTVNLALARTAGRRLTQYLISQTGIGGKSRRRLAKRPSVLRGEGHFYVDANSRSKELRKAIEPFEASRTRDAA